MIEELRALVPLAPLHQPYNLAAIEAVAERLPVVPQVACFDTSFHRGQPAVAELVPLPKAIRDAGVQRYGFHGLSYEYIASVLPEVAPEIADGRVIVAHLGSGASLCALKDGRSVDSTLGFTALDGLCMGTRPGSVDPGVILHLFQTLGLSAKEVETMLYKKSGLLGISGHQQRHARPARRATSPRHGWPWTTSCTRPPSRSARSRRCSAGSTALVFTAGIGEHSAPRSAAGSARPPPGSASSSTRRRTTGTGPGSRTAGSPVSAWVIPTNEELMIARHTGAMLGIAGTRA